MGARRNPRVEAARNLRHETLANVTRETKSSKQITKRSSRLYRRGTQSTTFPNSRQASAAEQATDGKKAKLCAMPVEPVVRNVHVTCTKKEGSFGKAQPIQNSLHFAITCCSHSSACCVCPIEVFHLCQRKENRPSSILRKAVRFLTSPSKRHPVTQPRAATSEIGALVDKSMVQSRRQQSRRVVIFGL